MLSQAVRRFGEGDLAARARVDGKDEIAALAQEFNTMAERLAEYRQSSLGELLQAQQASQAAIDSLPDPVLVLDAAGAILNLNARRRVDCSASGRPVARTRSRARARAARGRGARARSTSSQGRGAYAPRGLRGGGPGGVPEGSRHLLPRATPLYRRRAASRGRPSSSRT